MLVVCAAFAGVRAGLPPEGPRLNRSAASGRAPALPLQEGALLAAIDLGSNSFHMVVARNVLGQLRKIGRAHV